MKSEGPYYLSNPSPGEIKSSLSISISVLILGPQKDFVCPVTIKKIHGLHFELVSSADKQY